MEGGILEVEPSTESETEIAPPSLNLPLLFGSALLSIACYAMIMGLWMSACFVILIFFHEMGHFAAAKWRRVSVTTPVFIPFLGATIGIRDKLKTPQDEAWIGIGGPLFGIAACALAFALWTFCLSSKPVLEGLTVATIVNLVNLMPLRPLDGGRIAQVVGSWTKYLGVALMGIWTYITFSPIQILIWFMVYTEFHKKYETASIRIPERIYWAVGYCTLLGGGAFLFFVTAKRLIPLMK